MTFTQKFDDYVCIGDTLTCEVDGYTITAHTASLWGIEANYPDSDNAYLSEVANELLPEALEAAND